MRLRSFRILLGVIIVSTAIGSFIAVSVNSRDVATPEQVIWKCPVSCALTKEFKSQAEVLKKTHYAARRQLGRCLLDPNTSDDAIRQQADAVIKTDNDRFRFVINHLIHMGPSLSATQKQQLFDYCGQIMRDAGRRPEPSGPQVLSDQTAADTPPTQSSYECTGLSNQLQLTPEQFGIAAQANPHFAQEVKEMAGLVCHSHRVLVSLLEDCNTPDQTILTQTETFLDARSRLEQRTVDYIVSIRPCLTKKQIKQLTGMCNH